MKTLKLKDYDSSTLPISRKPFTANEPMVVEERYVSTKLQKSGVNEIISHFLSTLILSLDGKEYQTTEQGRVNPSQYKRIFEDLKDLPDGDIYFLYLYILHEADPDYIFDFKCTECGAENLESTFNLGEIEVYVVEDEADVEKAVTLIKGVGADRIKEVIISYILWRHVYNKKSFSDIKEETLRRCIHKFGDSDAHANLDKSDVQYMYSKDRRILYKEYGEMKGGADLKFVLECGSCGFAQSHNLDALRTFDFC